MLSIDCALRAKCTEIYEHQLFVQIQTNKC